MAKPCGKGTITEIVKGKKYRLALGGGKHPLAGTYSTGEKVPLDACALDNDGNLVRPQVTYGNATDEQRSAFSSWRVPEYMRAQETFMGTKRQAELRLEVMRRELKLSKDLMLKGIDVDELEACGLTVGLAIEADMSAIQVAGIIEQHREKERLKVTFAGWCEQYLSTREKLAKYRPATYKHDRGLAKHLVRGLGDKKLVDITPAMVSGLYASMRERGVGDTTIRQCHRLLKTMMRHALHNGLIPRNPVELAEAPRNPKPQRHALGVEDAARLSTCCTSGTPTANKVAVYLGLSLGARLGEVLGLEWRHVELDGERPFVHLVQQYTAQGKTAPLKTDKDENPLGRIVPIDASTVAVLSAWAAEQRIQLNALGIEQGTSTPIVTNSLGGFTDHANFQKWWRSFCIDNGFGRRVTDEGRELITLTLGEDADIYSSYHILWRDSEGWPCDENGKRYSRSHKRPKVATHYEGLHFHELRHTHFTIRLASGIDIPTAQALGGWATPTVLMNVYAHPVAQNVWASAGFMDRLTARKAVV